MTTAAQATIARRAAHVDTLLALGRLVVSARRPGVDASWFVLMTGLETGVHTIVRVDA